jgi:hypothetical protein
MGEDYGNDLSTPLQDPTGAIEIDAYGLAQATLTFAIDRDYLSGAIAYFSAGVAYPIDLGFSMTSYKYSVTLDKANLAKIKVDYIGVQQETGYTVPHIHGVVNTAAQPIETHPNFTKVTVSDYIIDPQALGGTPSAPENNAIFLPYSQKGNKTQYNFGGFGVSDNPDEPNPFQGIRQYLRPMTTVRGEMYFNASAQGMAEKLSAAVGSYLKSSDSQTLIYPWVVYGPTYGSRWLVTAAPIEPIGRPLSETDSPMCKVTYDLQYGGTAGWNPSIYPQSETIFG